MCRGRRPGKQVSEQSDAALQFRKMRFKEVVVVNLNLL